MKPIQPTPCMAVMRMTTIIAVDARTLSKPTDVEAGTVPSGRAASLATTAAATQAHAIDAQTG